MEKMRELSELELELVSGGLPPMRTPAMPYNSVQFANSQPEFPNAKPGSKKAAFDLWEDTLEYSTGEFGHGWIGPGINTVAAFLKII